MYEYIILAIIVIMTVHFLFKCARLKKQNKPNKSNKLDQLTEHYDNDWNNEYEDNLSILPAETCDRNKGTGYVNLEPGCTRAGVEEYSDKFFRFRDSTFNMSQMAEDPVDRINEMREHPDQFQGMKIRDIYDLMVRSDS